MSDNLWWNILMALIASILWVILILLIKTIITFIKNKLNIISNKINYWYNHNDENDTKTLPKIDIHNKIKVIHRLRKFYPRDFEEFVVLLFELKWYIIKKRPTYKGKNAKRDWGIDVEATKNWIDYYIQVKKLFTHEVSVKIIREFNWIMNNKQWKGIIITTSIFSNDSISEKWNLELIDYRMLLSEIESLPEDKLELLQEFINDTNHIDYNFDTKPITCKHCGAPMVKRYRRWRMFYWCMNYYNTHCTNQSDFLI